MKPPALDRAALDAYAWVADQSRVMRQLVASTAPARLNDRIRKVFDHPHRDHNRASVLIGVGQRVVRP